MKSKYPEVLRAIGTLEFSEELEKKKEAIRDYATKTIYTVSDMAQTYSQLAATGVKEKVIIELEEE